MDDSSVIHLNLSSEYRLFLMKTADTEQITLIIFAPLHSLLRTQNLKLPFCCISIQSLRDNMTLSFVICFRKWQSEQGARVMKAATEQVRYNSVEITCHPLNLQRWAVRRVYGCVNLHSDIMQPTLGPPQAQSHRNNVN